RRGSWREGRRHRRSSRPSSWVHGPWLSIRNAGDDPRDDRKLHGAQAQRFLGNVLGDAVDFEQDATRLDAGGPELDRTLAFTHADFGRLLGNRHVREDTDPDAA